MEGLVKMDVDESDWTGDLEVKGERQFAAAGLTYEVMTEAEAREKVSDLMEKDVGTLGSDFIARYVPVDTEEGGKLLTEYEEADSEDAEEMSGQLAAFMRSQGTWDDAVSARIDLYGWGLLLSNSERHSAEVTCDVTDTKYVVIAHREE